MPGHIAHAPSTHFSGNKSPLIVPRRSQGPAPASFVQESFWTVEQVTPDSGAYNERWALRLRGILDQEALAVSLEELCQRHSALRTTLVVQAGQLTQHITDSIPRLQLVNLSSIPQKRRAGELARRAREFVRAPFDLARGPLLRMALLKFAPDDHVLLCCAHHSIIDGWSVGIFIEDLKILYEAHRAKREAILPAISLDMGDFAAWQRRWLTKNVLDQLIAYWRTQLQDCPSALELPTDFPRPPIQSHKGNHIAVHLNEEIATWVHRFAQQENATPFMVMLSAFAIMLSEYAQQQEFAIGTSVAGRRPELEAVMGCFVNILPLRINLTGRPSFRDVVRNVREVALEAFEHQDVPFEKLVEELQVERDLSRMPIIQVMFAFLNMPTADLTLSDLTVSYEDVPAGIAKFDLTLLLREERGSLVGVLEYATELFEESSMQRMLEHLQLLLEQVIGDPDQPLDQLRLLSAQQQSLLSQVNATTAPLPAPTFLDLFAQTVQQTPHAPALVFEDQQWSYADLDGWAKQIAAHLQAAGVGREARVGVLLSRTPLLIASLLGIWKAGAAFVALDPTAPAARTRWIIEDAQVSLLIAHAQQDSLPSSLTVLTEAELASTPAHRLERVVPDPHDLAYIIYTSGSTGTPKGVLVEHVGLPNLAAAQQAVLAIRPGDRVLQFASFTFDATISEVTLALANSASLVLGSSLDLMPGEPLAHFLEKNRITHVILVPSALAQLPVQTFADLRVICVAGEECPLPLAQRWADRVIFFNLYGPTEASIWTTWARILPTELHRPAIGLPIANTQVYVLDEHLRPVPFGVAGELYIGGIGLARGYQGRPDLTQQRFLPHPFSSDASARLYKTGDRVRWRADGMLEFLGRLDEQVKVRGYRIEPGEIEAVLNTYPGIRQSAVVVQKDEEGQARLVAYLLGSQVEEEEKIMQFLRAHLPSYLLPSLLITCRTFPYTASGKIDRKALAASPHRPTPSHTITAARTKVEEQLVQIVSSVLERKEVGIFDNFFRIGGDSITCVRIANLAREQHIGIEVTDIFKYQTIAALAEVAKTLDEPVHIPTNEERDELSLLVLAQHQQAVDVYPLSAFQRIGLQRYLQVNDPASYLVVSSYRIHNTSWDENAFREAWQVVVARHAAMRTQFVWEGLPEPRQIVYPSVTVPLVIQDWRNESPEQNEQRIHDYLRAEWETGVDLSSAPCMRISLFYIGDGESILIWTRQHLLFDGWSRSLVLDDFFQAYTALTTKQKASNLGQSDPRQLIHRLRAQGTTSTYAFWSQQLSDYQPALLDGSEVAQVPTGPVERALVQLNAHDKRALEQVAREHTITLYEVVRMALAIAHSHVLKSTDILFAEMASGRAEGTDDIQQIVGNTLRLVPSRFMLHGQERWYEWIQAYRPIQLERQQRACLPIDSTSDGKPLFDSYLVYEHYPTSSRVTAETSNWEVVETIIPKTTFPYRFEILDADCIYLSCVFYTGATRQQRSQHMLHAWQAVLRNVLQNPEVTVQDLRKRCENMEEKSDRIN